MLFSQFWAKKRKKKCSLENELFPIFSQKYFSMWRENSFYILHPCSWSSPSYFRFKAPFSAKWQTNIGAMQPDISGTNPDMPQANKLQKLIA